MVDSLASAAWMAMGTLLLSLAAAFLYEPFRSWWQRKVSKLRDRRDYQARRRKRVRKQKREDQFIRSLRFGDLIQIAQKRGFKPYPSGSSVAESRFLSCEKYDPNDPDPLFQYFIRDEFPLQKFCGFLVPPLDAGRTGVPDVAGGELELSKGWERYLRRLVIKLYGVTGKASQRIVLLDKPLIHLFLSETMAREQFPEYKRAMEEFASHELKELLRMAEVIAHDTFQAHHEVGQRPIETLYVDKSVIRGNQYYDFGLYDTGECKIIYMPIFKKDIRKTVVEQRLYVSEIKGHRAHIRDFEEDFNEIWKEMREKADRLETKMEEDARILEYPDGEYYQADVYDRTAFIAGYGSRLARRFRMTDVRNERTPED